MHVLQNHTWAARVLSLPRHFHGLGGRGFGSSRPELAWAIRQKQQDPERPVDDQNKSVKSSHLTPQIQRHTCATFARCRVQPAPSVSNK